MKKPEAALKKIFGFKKFRPYQKEIITNILEGRDVFASLPTGGGKSICYQLPALLFEGITIVMSPLVALMKDQVDGARAYGIEAYCLNSSLSPMETADVYQALEAGKAKLLYISPERFAIDGFSENLKKFNVSFVAVDEAHCVSEWGHDFRPDYLSLSRIREFFPGSVIAAFTATATLKVQEDIIGLLKMRDPFLVRASFDRKELYYRIVPKNGANRQIYEFIRKRKKQSGIVYRLSRADVEKTAAYLSEKGIKALPYHAGLASKTREKNQDLFNRDEVDVVIATIAFGMGIDKSNIRFVVHGDLPKSVEGYYQETGRAGRDGLPSECLLLYSAGDIAKIHYFIDKISDENEKVRANRNLNNISNLASINVCRRKQILEYFNESYEGNCGACDICNGEAEQVDGTVDAQKVLSAIVRSGQRFGIGQIIDIVRGADTEKIRKFGHNELKTWGVGKDKSKVWWSSIVNELLGQKHIYRDPDSFNALKLNESGGDILYGRAGFSVLMKKEKEPEKKLNFREVDFDEELFSRLRDVRALIAKENKIPPYIVFSDKTLKEMSHLKPDDRSAMLRVSGVGERKMDQYGHKFLAEIRSYLGY
ncbi:DNA helicase RecQ [Spirochaeta isovalerica]|uniref:DNA helicase RecQ n=1 Tax=Spirochaeta isovalerica TaxID=150 RepID=A0A841RF99_9SPIO|nr:DNA helicase RecQ [Spirochaeta isovalerica]MBB6482663.1 ATP-dependent DNA helicase RecQ [Spirochaeta isovalerica]